MVYSEPFDFQGRDWVITPPKRFSMPVMIALCASILFAGSADADLLIDDYNQTGAYWAGGSFAGDMLGGVRTVQRFGRGSIILGSGSESLVAWADGVFGPATQITAVDLWGYDPGSPGSPELDLNLTGYAGIQIEFSATNQPFNVSLGLFHHIHTSRFAGASWHAGPVTVLPGVDSIFVPFSSFTPDAGTSIALDLGDIDSVSALFLKSNQVPDLANTPVYSVDNIRFVVQALPVPEPNTYAMMLVGILMAGFMARQKRSAC